MRESSVGNAAVRPKRKKVCREDNLSVVSGQLVQEAKDWGEDMTVVGCKSLSVKTTREIGSTESTVHLPSQGVQRRHAIVSPHGEKGRHVGCQELHRRGTTKYTMIGLPFEHATCQ